MQDSKSDSSIQNWFCGDLSNYRAISVLPPFSKLLEKYVAKLFISHLVDQELLRKLQSAFRKGYSIKSALIKLTYQILINMDNKVEKVIT